MTTVITDWAAELEDIEGAELLTPPARVKASRRIRLVSRLKNMAMASGEDGESIDLARIDMDELADLLDYISENFALKPDEFDLWTARAGVSASLKLAVAYAGVLGKSMTSGTSSDSPPS